MNVVFYAFVAVSLGWLLLFLSGRRFPWPLLLALGVSPVILIYALNPEFRVYSFHSFMHAGIVYQILNGNVPPPDPLFAGHTVPYPWAVHLVAAGISRVFNVTPFLAIAALNVVSLGLVMVLVHRISRLVVKDARANILSVVVAVYAVTFTNPSLMKVLSLPITTEFRGVPILLKFITINVLPVGLVFFLLFVYSVLRLEATRRMFPHAWVLVASILGTGFAYPAFLPGVGLSLVFAWVVNLALFRRQALRWSLPTLAATVAALVVSAVAVRPYLSLLTAGTLSQMQVLVPRLVAANLARYLVVALPLAVVILANRAAFKSSEPKPLIFIAVVVLATAVGYFALHLNMDNEYKMLLLSTVVLGIPGGIAFGHLAGRCRGWKVVGVFLLLAAFLFPAFRFVRLKLVQERAGRPSQEFVEKGRSLHPADSEADRFYRWVKENTGPRSAFIDRDLGICVLGERAIFVPAGGPELRERKGFGPVDLILRQQSGYPDELIRARRTIMDKIYQGKTLNGSELEQLRGLTGGIYVVRRADGAAAGPGAADLAGDLLTEVFASPSGGYKLYKMNLPQRP
jgi:hypothetical protein